MAKSKPEPERPGYVRTTITVPADLKQEMEKVADRENWSALAAECFRARVAAIKASQLTRGDMKKIVERLKAAKEQDEVDEYEDGKRAGRDWAADYATPAQLRRLAAADAEQYAWAGSPNAPWGWRHLVAFKINPKFDRDDRPTAKELVDDFWERALGGDSDRVKEGPGDMAVNDFLRGFIEGAIEIWEEVEDQV